MQDYLNVTRALSDEARVRALVAIAGGELCLCQIIELLRLAPSTVSKHMSILQQAGLVTRRKAGRWHYYRLADHGAPAVVQQAIQWTLRSLANQERIAADARQLCCVREQDPQALTACYAPGAKEAR